MGAAATPSDIPTEWHALYEVIAKTPVQKMEQSKEALFVVEE